MRIMYHGAGEVENNDVQANKKVLSTPLLGGRMPFQFSLSIPRHHVLKFIV
jgi:hypothetical protein